MLVGFIQNNVNMLHKIGIYIIIVIVIIYRVFFPLATQQSLARLIQETTGIKNIRNLDI